jgi:hypothetical protein
MQAPIVVAPQHRIAALAVHIQTRRAGHQNLMPITFHVMQTLDSTLPHRVFVQLIKNQQRIIFAHFLANSAWRSSSKSQLKYRPF